MRRPHIALALFGALLATRAQAQAPNANPLVELAGTIGSRGLGPDTLASKPGWPFKPAAGRLYIKSYVATISEVPDEQAALEAGILAVIDGYETAATGIGQPNDPATALAFSIAVLQSVSTGSELDEAAFVALTPRLRAHLATVAATDRQKQEFYEWSLCNTGLVVALMGATTDPAARTKLKSLAGIALVNLVGARSEAITLKGDKVAIRAATPPPVPKLDAAAKPVTTNSGLKYAFPSDWKTVGVWTVGEKWRGSDVSKAQIRLVPAVPARGNFDEALRAAWNQYVPEEIRGNVSGMTFRRYVGDGLTSHFVCGTGEEKGRKWNSLWTVYLVDCGATWQPIVIAQTWEDTATPFPMGASMSADFSFADTTVIAETFLQTLSLPGAKGKPLVDPKAMVGAYKYGTSSTLQWENVRTGATAMSVVSYGGALTLGADGKFTESYSSATGYVGSLKFNGIKARGTWRVEGDQLILKYTEYDQGDGYKRTEERKKIAGIVTFSDGVKIVVLKFRGTDPVNAQSVQDRSEWFSTDKPK